jgi:hypothetical protein
MRIKSDLIMRARGAALAAQDHGPGRAAGRPRSHVPWASTTPTIGVGTQPSGCR